MPFKANAERRHRIPRQRHRAMNSAVYDAALRQRGSLTIWFTDTVIAAWKAEPRTTRGGQPRYSGLAIATALTLRAVFRLALRQTKGLIGTVLQGVPRVNDQRVVSRILHLIRNRLRWRDAPAEYGPHKTLYNRFVRWSRLGVRWSRLGVFDRIFAGLAAVLVSSSA